MSGTGSAAGRSIIGVGVSAVGAGGLMNGTGSAAGRSIIGVGVSAVATGSLVSGTAGTAGRLIIGVGVSAVGAGSLVSETAGKDGFDGGRELDSASASVPAEAGVAAALVKALPGSGLVEAELTPEAPIGKVAVPVTIARGCCRRLPSWLISR